MSFELIIMGMETSVWIALCCVQIYGIELLSTFPEKANNLPSVLTGIGLFYILGLIMDRASGFIFRIVRRVGRRSVRDGSTKVYLYASNGITEHIYRSRIHIRLMRATVINSLLITIFSATLLATMGSGVLSIFVALIVGTLVICVCLNSYTVRQKIYFETADRLARDRPELIRVFDINLESRRDEA